MDDGAVVELLTAVAAMGESAQRRVLSLPALVDQELLARFVEVAVAHQLTPLLAKLDSDLLRRVATESSRRR
jgi:hypothetical protein